MSTGPCVTAEEEVYNTCARPLGTPSCIGTSRHVSPALPFHSPFCPKARTSDIISATALLGREDQPPLPLPPPPILAQPRTGRYTLPFPRPSHRRHNDYVWVQLPCTVVLLPTCLASRSLVAVATGRTWQRARAPRAKASRTAHRALGHGQDIWVLRDSKQKRLAGR